MTKEAYLMMCEQLGNEPLEEEIPYDFGDFPNCVQEAITIYYILSDRWEGFSGSYLGKDYNLLPYLAGIYEVENEIQLLQFLLMIDKIVSTIRTREQKQRQKKSSSKKSNINIQG